MKKIINPCMCEVHGGKARGFVKIEYENGVLSMSGAIGPMKSGNAKGACGQCVDEIRKGDPGNGWSREMLDRLAQVWDTWHLNDMRPYCEHQKALGWDKLARQKVTLYNFRLTREALSKKKEAERAALTALREGMAFVPTEEQVRYAAMPYSIKTHEMLSGEVAEIYELKERLFAGDEGATETKALGWLHQNEHPEGILGRPCPVCGYKYGTSWIKEDVPKEVIDWLAALPETEVQPAWI